MFRNLYEKLTVEITISLLSGIKQNLLLLPQSKKGFVKEPSLRHFFTVVETQHVVKPSFLYLSQDISLLNYVDDILRLCGSF